MDLFTPDPTVNLLPCDGVVNDYGRIMSEEEASGLQTTLETTIEWRHDEVVMFGRRIVTARQVAWYGDAGFAYAYSGTTKQALPWTPDLAGLKARLESLTGEVFNSCLLNFYADGSQGMGWHSDDEGTLVQDAAIASVSLGAARKFCFKHRRLDLGVSIMLEHGSLLVMKGETQRHWLHALPKSKRVAGARINLTFRRMKTQKA